MIALVRIAAIGATAAMLWTVTASRVPHHLKLARSQIVAGAAMTLPYGCTSFELEPFDALCPYHHLHTGVDLAAPAGTAVRAAVGGTAHVGFDASGAGLYVVVVSDGHYRELYCHLSAALVAEGEDVATGDVIGQVGATGLATGPHLHFEVQLEGRPVNPDRWLAS